MSTPPKDDMYISCAVLSYYTSLEKDSVLRELDPGRPQPAQFCKRTTGGRAALVGTFVEQAVAEMRAV
ncbi:hypothetical protein GN956_G18708 [Arapaima gigas]